MIDNKIKIPQIPFYFVRHGQTDWNKENKVMGKVDIPLNEVGLKQAHTVAQNISDLEISHIISGPLKRTRQTSEIIGNALNKPITVIEEFNQASLGIMEGQYKRDEYKEWIESWKKGGDIQGAELWSNFVSRIAAGLNIALAGNSDTLVLIVAHGGPVYWALLHILKAQAVDMNAQNCVVYFFRPSNSDLNQWVVSALDE